MSKPRPPRKELTSIRLEPQVKYLAEIASRVQRRSLTNFIEWVLEESIKNMKLRDDPNDDRTIGNCSFLLWDTNPSERLISLAIIAPELLDHDEQLVFKVIINKRYNLLSYPALTVTKDHQGNYVISGQGNFPQQLELEYFNINKINDNWVNIVKAAFDDEEAIKALKDEADIPQKNSYYDEPPF